MHWRYSFHYIPPICKRLTSGSVRCLRCLHKIHINFGLDVVTLYIPSYLDNLVTFYSQEHILKVCICTIKFNRYVQQSHPRSSRSKIVVEHSRRAICRNQMSMSRLRLWSSLILTPSSTSSMLKGTIKLGSSYFTEIMQ